jgi:hypothetical protein
MLIHVASLLLATAPLKIEEVIAHEMPQEQQESLTVEENLHGGKILILSDGTKWEIAPQDLSTSSSWILSVPMKVEKSNNKMYPYKIININSQSSVLARPLSS